MMQIQRQQQQLLPHTDKINDLLGEKSGKIIEYEKTIRDIDATLTILEIWAK